MRPQERRRGLSPALDPRPVALRLQPFTRCSGSAPSSCAAASIHSSCGDASSPSVCRAQPVKAREDRPLAAAVVLVVGVAVVAELDARMLRERVPSASPSTTRNACEPSSRSLARAARAPRDARRPPMPAQMRAERRRVHALPLLPPVVARLRQCAARKAAVACRPHRPTVTRRRAARRGCASPRSTTRARRTGGAATTRPGRTRRRAHSARPTAPTASRGRSGRTSRRSARRSRSRRRATSPQR